MGVVRDAGHPHGRFGNFLPENVDIPAVGQRPEEEFELARLSTPTCRERRGLTVTIVTSCYQYLIAHAKGSK